MTSAEMRTAGAPAPETTERPPRMRPPRPLPPLRRRMVPRLSPGAAGWAAPIAVALVAGVLRFYRLGTPRAFVFDETYYAKDAWSLLHFNVEMEYVKDANDKILAGNTDVFTGNSAYVVHPPAGKWIIGVGEQLFGFNPFGWRFMVALLGTLSVLMIARIARRMTGSTVLGCTAGLLLAVDGLHFVMSRTSLLDLILMFWIVAAFGCLLVDRDRARGRLAALAEQHGGTLAWVGAARGDDPPRPPRGAGRGDDPPRPPRGANRGDGSAWALSGGEFGPRLGWRPWRLLAGVCLGLATATKWNGLFAVVAFAILAFLWDSGARRAAGVRSPFLGALVRDALPTLGAIVGIAAAVYMASWTGWFVSDDGYDRDWAAGRGWKYGIVPEAVRSLWHYHAQVYNFHTHLSRSGSPHPYMSSPWGWLVLARPVSYYYVGYKNGQHGCSVDSCSSAVLALGTPTLWWLGIAAIVFCIWLWLARRDWRAAAVLAGIAATYLPWFHYTERTIFYFYAVAVVPFLVLAVTLLLGHILGPPNASPQRRAVGAGIAGAIVLLVVLTFVYFYPIYTADVIPYTDWHDRMWFQSWI